MTIAVLDLKLSQGPSQRNLLLDQSRDALFNIGFLYIHNHGVLEETVSELVRRVPKTYDLSDLSKSRFSKMNSPHFLGCSGLAEATIPGRRNLRQQFDFATELPITY